MSTSTRRPRLSRVDWVQLIAALVMIVSYATTVWLARREEHDGGGPR